MPKPILLTVVFCLTSACTFSQLTDNFNDGDFTTNPQWPGNTSDFVVNSSLQLQSNNRVANSTFHLSTASTLAANTQWEMYMSFTFNPSSANYIDVFLTASQADLTDAGTTGYFIRVGNTDDEVSLYRKDATGSPTKIIDGTNGILNNSSNVLKLKVILGIGNQFTLLRDITGTGNNYVSEGFAVDGTFGTSFYFGFVVKQSTAGFFQRHFFDDIEVKTYVPDITPPAIQSITPISYNMIDVLFSETVEVTSSQSAANYSVSNGIANAALAVRDPINGALVHLTFMGSFTNGLNYTLTVIGVTDVAGNPISSGTAAFSFYVPQRYDVVIDEIMADPAPAVNLPNAEFIELKNISSRSINLQGWRLASVTSLSAAFPSYTLLPDSFIIVTSSLNSSLFSPYGSVLGITGFPALDNQGTTLSLISKESYLIHAVSYDETWYTNAVKSQGGWTLEMVDTKNPCAGTLNWQASLNPRGGTPGVKNSVDGINKDEVPPALVRAHATDSVTVVLHFDEPLDSSTAALAANYSISGGVGTASAAAAMGPLYNRVQIKTATALVRNEVYNITAKNITDCSGNTLQALNSTRVGLASIIDTFDIIINEVLFNPKPNGVDYVEIINRSDKILDLKDLSIGNRSSSTNIIGSIRAIAGESILIYPGDYFVVSENGAVVKQQYVAVNPGNFADVPSMPSYPDDKGTVVILSGQGRIIDELRYDEKWHFSLVDNAEGIALERIDPDKPTQIKDNWFSAATTAGYGTPSYQNSQLRADLQVRGEVTITPKIFSPDNDGFDDFAIVGYKMTERGYVANITILDAVGQPIKYLVKNAMLAPTGSFRWDGLDEKLQKVPVGTYVVYTEVFNVNGRKKSFKNVVVVAARL